MVTSTCANVCRSSVTFNQSFYTTYYYQRLLQQQSYCCGDESCRSCRSTRYSSQLLTTVRIQYKTLYKLVCCSGYKEEGSNCVRETSSASSAIDIAKIAGIPGGSIILLFIIGVCVANYETCFGAAVSQNNPEEFSADIIRKESSLAIYFHKRRQRKSQQKYIRSLKGNNRAMEDQGILQEKNRVMEHKVKESNLHTSQYFNTDTGIQEPSRQNCPTAEVNAGYHQNAIFSDPSPNPNVMFYNTPSYALHNPVQSY